MIGRPTPCLHVAEEGPAPQGLQALLLCDDLEGVHHVPVPHWVAGRSLDLRAHMQPDGHRLFTSRSLCSHTTGTCAVISQGVHFMSCKLQAEQSGAAAAMQGESLFESRWQCAVHYRRFCEVAAPWADLHPPRHDLQGHRRRHDANGSAARYPSSFTCTAHMMTHRLF